MPVPRVDIDSQEFPGTISACYSDSTYAVDYDDGSFSLFTLMAT